MKIIKIILFCITCFLILWLFVSLALYMGELAYQSAIDEGFADDKAVNIALMATATMALILTSDTLYKLFRSLINALLSHAKGVFYSMLLGAKAAMEIYMALPKRTILFVIYLLLIILELLGLIQTAKDYAVSAVYIIAVDRVLKIWAIEKERLIEYCGKIRKRLRQLREE